MTVDQPSFFLTGDADGVIRMRPVQEDALRKDAPGLRGMRVLPDVGHWPHREAPEATNALLLDFLKGLD